MAKLYEMQADEGRYFSHQYKNGNSLKKVEAVDKLMHQVDVGTQSLQVLRCNSVRARTELRVTRSPALCNFRRHHM